MDHREEFGPRVQRCADGVYRWRALLDRAQHKQVVRITLGVCGGTCLLFIVLALLLGPDMLGVMLLTCLAIMAIAGLVCWLYIRGSRNSWQPYEMTEEYVRYVSIGSADTYFHFKDIRKVIVQADRDRIVVNSLLVTAPVFVPHEDFAFVQNYILRRLPDRTAVVYR